MDLSGPRMDFSMVPLSRINATVVPMYGPDCTMNTEGLLVSVFMLKPAADLDELPASTWTQPTKLFYTWGYKNRLDLTAHPTENTALPLQFYQKEHNLSVALLIMCMFMYNVLFCVSLLVCQNSKKIKFAVGLFQTSLYMCLIESNMGNIFLI